MSRVFIQSIEWKWVKICFGETLEGILQSNGKVYLISVWYIYSLSTFRHIAGYAGAPGHTHLIDLFHLLHRTFAAHIKKLRNETPRNGWWKTKIIRTQQQKQKVKLSIFLLANSVEVFD
jgi:hypothetical protein